MTPEDDILMACALRFDGYKYLDAHPFDHREALGRFCRTNGWEHTSPLEELTIFFGLQRFLYKWGGEMLPKTSQDWRAFRSLFLKTHGYTIPEQYRHRAYYASWERRFAPDLEEHAALVREIHANTEYDARPPERAGRGPSKRTDRNA